VLLAACAPPDDRPSAPVDDTPATDPPVDSAPPDTEAKADTDPPPAPPASWGTGFVELLAPVWVEAPLPVLPGSFDDQQRGQSSVAWFADLDGDDVAELFVGTSIVGTELTTWAGHVLRWTPDGLVRDAALSAALAPGDDAPRLAFDLDQDGLVDLLGGARLSVRWGVGPGRWSAWTSIDEDSPVPAARHAVGVADVDQDGWLDLLFGGITCDVAGYVALRTGPRAYTLRDDLLRAPGAPVNAFLVGTLDDGVPVIYAGAEGCPEVEGSRFLRRTGWGDDLVPRFDAVDPAPDDVWWRLQPTEAWTIDDMAPMGSGIEDLDGDGFLDLVVTVGSSGQVLLFGNGDGTFAGRRAPPFVSWPNVDELGRPELPWSVGFPDLDLDGRGDVLWTIGDDASSFLAPRGHLMRNQVSWNGGGGRFVTVPELGLDALGSWEALALGDPDGDGDADVAVGSTGYLPAAWRNDVDVAGRRGVSLAFRGTTSNPRGLGARVVVHVAGLPDRVLAPGALGDPNGVSEVLAFVGAGDATAIDRVEVRWPTGRTQVYDGLEVGRRHTLVEAPVIELDDADRHAPAGGTDPITLRVTPRRPDGAVDPAADVTVRFLGATPAAQAEPVDAGVRTWTLRPAAVPGVTQVVVAIDGVDLEVRPKLWWDGPG
jgi:hypothetical protein